MSRALATAFKNMTTSSSLAPVLFAYFDFYTAPVRVWTGIGSVSWGGDTYLGLGTMGTISTVSETTDVKANGLVFQLCGIDPTLISTVLSDNYHGRACKLWLGALSPSETIVADPYLIFSGRMDGLEIDDGVSTSTIRVSAESVLVDLLRNRERRYTNEDQHIDFPSDEGMAFMPTAQSTPFQWGGQNAGGNSAPGSSRTSDNAAVEFE
jgi:hypothetical protein